MQFVDFPFLSILALPPHLRFNARQFDTCRLRFDDGFRTSDIPHADTTARYAHLARDSVHESAARIADSIAADILGENWTVHAG